jgi:hypothetical protein
LPADVGAGPKLVRAEDRRKVVNKLIVGLISLDREVAGTADTRLRRDRSRIEEPNDGRVVTGGDVYQSSSEAEALAELTDRRCRKQVRPSHAKVLLLVVLIGTFAGNDIVSAEPLPRVLPTCGDVVGLTRVPVEPA